MVFLALHFFKRVRKVDALIRALLIGYKHTEYRVKQKKHPYIIVEIIAFLLRLDYKMTEKKN